MCFIVSVLIQNSDREICPLFLRLVMLNTLLFFSATRNDVRSTSKLSKEKEANGEEERETLYILSSVDISLDRVASEPVKGLR